MRGRLPEFTRRGLRVAAVVQGTAEEADRLWSRHGVASICVPDPEKASYRAMGLPRTSWRAIVFAAADLKRRRAETKAAGCRNSVAGALRSHSDVLQLPGAALIARGGTVRWLHRGRHPGDLPGPEALLAAADRVLSPTGKETLR